MSLRSNMPRRQRGFCGIRTYVLLWMMLLSVLPLTAQDRFDSVRSLIRQQIVNGSAPSISVAVARHGKIVWEQSFGWANREEMIPATVNTMYSLASISKPLTATGLMTLVQDGKIDLDTPINNYLGDAKLKARIGNAKNATVRRVANHSAGLPFHYQFFYSDQPYPKPSYDQTISRYGNLVAIPGEHFQYSNLDYGILGYVLARISGENYPEFMRQNVFLKLGMTHTSVGISSGLKAFQAIRYDDKGARIPFYVTDTTGASDIYSSVHDLIRFAMFQLKDHLPDQTQILTDASIDTMQKPTMKISDRLGYGIGWDIEDRSDGYRVVSHTGGMPGVATVLMLVPSEDIAVAVLTNTLHYPPTKIFEIVNAIFTALLPKWQVPPPKPQATVPFTLDPRLLGIWKGTLYTYQKDLPVTLIFLRSGEVHVQLADELPSLLNKVQFKDGWLSGDAWGEMPTGDAERHHTNTLQFSLKLRGNHLNGAVSATVHNCICVALSQWLDVQKQP